MVMNVTVKFDPSDVIDKLNQIKNGLGDRALRSAVNKIGAQALTQMSKAIRDDYNISAAMVKERLQLRKAIGGKHAMFTAVLIGNPASGGIRRSMNLVHFLEKGAIEKAFKRGSGWQLDQLRFQVRRAGGKQSITGAFVGNKRRTVFVREGKARLPIKAVRTIGVPQMFSTRKNVGLVQAFIRENFPRILQSDVKYFLSTIK